MENTVRSQKAKSVESDVLIPASIILLNVTRIISNTQTLVAVLLQYAATVMSIAKYIIKLSLYEPIQMKKNKKESIGETVNTILRPYQTEEDYWRIRGFLRDVSLYNDRHDFAWSLLRWDYWRWHVNENIFHFNLQDVVTLWELNGQIVAMLNPAGEGEAFFQVHPAFRDVVCISEILDVAEKKLPKMNADGNKELIVRVNAVDNATKELFAQHGYVRSKYSAEHMRRRFFSDVPPDSAIPSGYSIRALGDESELPARSWLSGKAFHPDELDDNYQGSEWYRNVQRIPLYRRDLDIVAVAEDGDLAAFCSVWFDDVTRTAVFEPVGTHPNHQKRGLGKAVMSEGLRRAQRLGATLATVSSYGTAAHALYESMGFTEFDLLEPWIREWS